MKKIIHIAGLGFSGSTFLDMLLSSFKGFIGVGEMMFLQDYIIYEKRCMCGESLKKCRQWSIMNKFLNSKNYKAFLYEKFHHDFFMIN